MKETNEDRALADKNVWKDGGVNLSEIAGKETILRAVDLDRFHITIPDNFPSSRWSIGKHTLAINSLFLNSPLTSVTFPFSSNSVHRKRSSFGALAVRLRPT